MSKNKNALTVSKEKLSEIRKAFVKQAEHNVKDENQQLFQQFFDSVIRKIQECEKTIAIGKAGLAHFTAQKQALIDGEFHFHLFRKTVVFNEEKLNGNYQEQ